MDFALSCSVGTMEQNPANIAEINTPQKQNLVEVWTDKGICVRNRVFVGGLPKSMTELELEIVFSGHGHVVQDVRIVQDMRTGATKGYGFVTFRTVDEADEVQALREIFWRGKRLRISTAFKKKTVHKRTGPFVFDSGLPLAEAEHPVPGEPWAMAMITYQNASGGIQAVHVAPVKLDSGLSIAEAEHAWLNPVDDYWLPAKIPNGSPVLQLPFSPSLFPVAVGCGPMVY